MSAPIIGKLSWSGAENWNLRWDSDTANKSIHSGRRVCLVHGSFRPLGRLSSCLLATSHSFCFSQFSSNLIISNRIHLYKIKMWKWRNLKYPFILIILILYHKKESTCIFFCDTQIYFTFSKFSNFKQST